MNKINVNISPMFPDVVIPAYQTVGSAGCDVRAYLPEKNPIRIFAGDTKTIPTGLKFSVPDGYEMQIRPRSGLSLKTKLRIANSPGTLDSDYRGELMIIMENVTNTSNSEVINHGDRIAQIVFAPIVQASFLVVESLDETERGSGGMGSTGIK